jgi:hypothetical protein
MPVGVTVNTQSFPISENPAKVSHARLRHLNPKRVAIQTNVALSKAI